MHYPREGEASYEYCTPYGAWSIHTRGTEDTVHIQKEQKIVVLCGKRVPGLRYCYCYRHQGKGEKRRKKTRTAKRMSDRKLPPVRTSRSFDILKQSMFMIPTIDPRRKRKKQRSPLNYRWMSTVPRARPTMHSSRDTGAKGPEKLSLLGKEKQMALINSQLDLGITT